MDGERACWGLIISMEQEKPMSLEQIRVTVRKVCVSMASSYPWQKLYQQVWVNLRC